MFNLEDSRSNYNQKLDIKSFSQKVNDLAMLVVTTKKGAARFNYERDFIDRSNVHAQKWNSMLEDIKKKHHLVYTMCMFEKQRYLSSFKDEEFKKQEMERLDS